MPADYPAILNNHLGHAYHAVVVGHGPQEREVAALRHAFEADRDLRKEAERRWNEIGAHGAVITQRDYVSKVFFDLLGKALGKA